ncbi:redox-regulated ATPase YchF [candidate division WWE3 bacterium RIFCSPHIGHO2_12_FULL_38_15]|uniref:Ribosome-binding ATPase YchF n=1 Tax=candidate division WWE3 bacterium RIFCSPHIGHO2_02_FULL_38_14 TaxID=1802620 RepID=A0A1F4V736_UNCKA|nr:MAG: redox-regulated ATPase YchF [candidate division WWE3 bacterium RIFCSPHIGHO2_01_FULL_38_45]OGC48872.1 MAG: redox-regulated ATPase YchF [candidate division WWE3 bacterium RIFCSPHIGHO2_12_FULL_38_15]OGC53019.1 MAG: redox-regulated ATPase YchF [candidate division WWE3 bacterium RIFCSPHIGHO2_02_FULL_38_14]OGC53175.1 MAG: redox-regulated ATPase YchF [candidate division WWE3 bacterium RIFCSPLOWO2_01_FULL_37_24]HLB52020.1 redox-regulated ATPase YchF [Patescibacteria group bacterium]
MSLSVGIVGLPNVGKSTLFNALLKRQAALAANYPFATIEPNVGIVDVPDIRLEKLVEVVKNEYSSKFKDREIPEKVIPAVVKFYDIAGLVKGASQGEGLGNQFLAHIREVDSIVHVVRAFNDENVVKAGSVNPKEDIEVINTELALADLQTVQKVYNRVEGDYKKNKDKENTEKLNIMNKLNSGLNNGEPARDILTKDEKDSAKDLNLLTIKPVIFVLNVSEEELNNNIAQWLGNSTNNAIIICAKVESELCSFDEGEKQTYMKSIGITESGLDKLIRKAYKILELQSFLTAGPKELRAWTIKKGTKAPQAAGVIHTDFERGFITAEVVGFDNLIEAGSWKIAKDRGLIRIEGKNYVMQDGDVVEFRFSA